MKPERVREIALRFQPPNPITTHLHSPKTITRFPFYSPSFSQLPQLIILFLLKKLVGTRIIKIELKICLGKERPPNDPSPPFKEEEEGEGRSKAWWPMGVSKLGGQWKEKNTFSPLAPFPPTIFLKPPIFPFALKVLLYRGLRLLLPHFFSFLRSINYACASQCDKSSTPTLSIRF
jgi:hypothetical protein